MNDKTEMERRVEELEEALLAAEEANRAKSRFLSNMSHDIRTPMNAIAGMTAIALGHIDEKARVQDCLLKIQTASTHLMSLVNDVLDMSRIDSGRMLLNTERFDLADLVHDVAVIVRPQAREKSQEFRLEIGHICQEDLEGDPLRLRQIMVNIINNAIKYTQEGGRVRLSLSQRQEQERVWLDFLCEDNGIGMSEEFLQRIFQPFERVRTAQVSRIEGTGLGMSIVKNLVDQMGGTIFVESQEGEGSRFAVSLPFPSGQEESPRAAFPPGQTVLVAESGDTGQLEDCLRTAGLEPVRMTAGLAAVTWLTEAGCEGRMPCAMVLGQELSDMPVLEAASHVRQLAGEEFPILLVSEEDWAAVEYRATRAGVNAFVPRPFFPSRLLNTLSQLLSSKPADPVSASRETDYSAYRVLLVEDNDLNQEIAIELLSLTGVQVETAWNGAEALQKVQSSPEGWFDLIFMDVQMPVMDGYEATRLIRALPRPDAQRIWIVAMTANAFMEDVRQSQGAGMDEHVSKPIDLKRMQDVLCRLLPRKRKTDGRGAVT